MGAYSRGRLIEALQYMLFVTHSLGMDHDGLGNTCTDRQRVMSSDGGSAADAFHWSMCSTDYLQQFLR